MGRPTKTADFVNAAFGLRYPVKGFGDVPVNYIAIGLFTILGFVAPIFWFGGIVAEASFLFWLSTSKRFRDYVVGKSLLQEREQWNSGLNGKAKELEYDNREAFQDLCQQCAEIEKACSENIPDSVLLEVRNLQSIFLRMLLLKQRLEQAMGKAKSDEIGKTIARTQKALDQETNENVKKSLESTLQIQNDRLANIQKSKDNLRLTTTEIERISNQIRLIGEEISLNRDPEQLSEAVNGIVRSIQETSKAVSESAGIFESIEISTAPGMVVQ